MGKVLGILLGLLTAAAAHARHPDIYVRDFDQLLFPPQLTKSEIQFALDRATAEMYPQAFTRLGTFADFMHGHVVFRPKDAAMPSPEAQMTDLSWKPEWEKFDKVAILFHTQEELERVYPEAPAPEYGNRNWLLWLEDQGDKKRGDMARAEGFQKPNPVAEYTVHTDELDPARFGDRAGEFEYSFYFIRIDCAQVDSVSDAFGPESNLMQVKVGNEQVCLTIVNFHCRQDYNSSRPQCQGSKVLTPYYRPIEEMMSAISGQSAQAGEAKSK